MNAANDSTRTAFAADCRRVIDKFGLDGIDIDWEYPGSGTAAYLFLLPIRRILLF